MRRVHFDVTDSTNLQARRLAEAHPGEALLVTAAEQSAGRGRQGRAWQSPRGGAWLSIVWPTRHEPSVYSAVSLVAAVAALRALRDVEPACASRLQIKWPNDVLVDGGKVAGILCENCPVGGSSRAPALIIGVGVNVDFDPAELGVELRHPATSLRAVGGRAVAVEEVIAAVSGRISEFMTVFELEGLNDSMLAELRGRLAYVGTVQTCSEAGRQMRGRVLGLDAAGRLLLKCESGEVACSAGELLVDAVAPVGDSI
jgi:BirA family biotin operon repressor/biotin-[acetyl-CoA-carboxylase] ligase